VTEKTFAEDDETVEFVLTNAVFLTLQGQLKDNGFVIRFKDENTELRQVEFYTSDVADPALRPRVFITSSTPAVFRDDAPPRHTGGAGRGFRRGAGRRARRRDRGARGVRVGLYLLGERVDAGDARASALGGFVQTLDDSLGVLQYNPAAVAWSKRVAFGVAGYFTSDLNQTVGYEERVKRHQALQPDGGVPVYKKLLTGSIGFRGRYDPDGSFQIARETSEGDPTATSTNVPAVCLRCRSRWPSTRENTPRWARSTPSSGAPWTRAGDRLRGQQRGRGEHAGAAPDRARHRRGFVNAAIPNCRWA